MSASCPHPPASGAGNDAALIGERAATRGHVAIGAGDAHARCEQRVIQFEFQPREPYRPGPATNGPRRTTRPWTRTLVDDIALDAGWCAGWRRVVTPVLEPHCPGDWISVSRPCAAAGAATMRRSSANAPQRAWASQRKVALSTLCQEGTQSAMLCER
jgi:hypothetical protein